MSSLTLARCPLGPSAAPSPSFAGVPSRPRPLRRPYNVDGSGVTGPIDPSYVGALIQARL
jgi:hypothetical protein